jgi:hypothetical protein
MVHPPQSMVSSAGPPVTVVSVCVALPVAGVKTQGTAWAALAPVSIPMAMTTVPARRLLRICGGEGGS